MDLIHMSVLFSLSLPPRLKDGLKDGPCGAKTVLDYLSYIPPHLALFIPYRVRRGKGRDNARLERESLAVAFT